MLRSFSLLLVMVGWLVITPMTVRAQAAPLAPSATTWHVAPGGSNGNNCLAPATACATLAGALGKAANGDTIQMAAGTYNVVDVEVSTQVTIQGAGPGATILDGGEAGRILRLNNTVTLADLRLQNGRTPTGSLFTASGGALLVSGNATLRNVDVVDNVAADSGGGIFNLGHLTLENSRVLSNTATGAGGGLYNYNNGVITVTHSAISYNVAEAYESGAGIFAGGSWPSTVPPLPITAVTPLAAAWWCP